MNMIKKLRKDMRLSQSDFASILGVKQNTVSNWENNKSFPDLETIEQISEKLGIESQYLIYGKFTEKNYRKLLTNIEK